MDNPNGKANDNDAASAAACGDAQQNPSDNPTNGGDEAGSCRRRTPFTDLSQVDADLALARTLQEQERVYMMLRMEAGDVSDYGSWEAESFEREDEFDRDDYDGSDLEVSGEVDDDDDDDDDEEEEEEEEEVEVEAEDAFDLHPQPDGVGNINQNSELDPSSFSSDEAYARALQDTEEREMASRLLALAGINEMVEDDEDDDDDDEEEEDEDEDDDDADEDDDYDDNEDAWQEVDPDELSYEELLALSDIVGTESRGLSADKIASLPSINYKSLGVQEGINDSCVICRLDFEDGDTLTPLPCKHSYHTECINNWLHINKVCPVCSAEVSTSGKSL